MSTRRVVPSAVVALVVAGAAVAGTGVLSSEDSSGARDEAALVAQSTVGFRSEPGLRPPKIEVYKRGDGLAPGLVFLGPKVRKGSRQSGVMIADDAGEPVFFRPARKGLRANDVRVQTYDGKPVLTWWEGTPKGGYGYGAGYIADTSYRVIKRVRTGSPYRMDMHEFKLTPRGTALVIAYRPTTADLRSVGGPARGRVMDNVLQEVDVDTGRVLFSWRALGNVSLRESYRPRSADRGEPWDYFHLNSVDVDEDGNYLVSARYSYSALKISRRTGRVVWRLGGKRSDFRMGAGSRFVLAHDAQWVRDGEVLRIFDNSKKGLRDDRSRVLTLRLDTRRKRVALTGDLRHPEKVLAATQANANAVGDDHLFVGWGSQGRWSEFDAAGRLLLDAELPAGYDSYRAYRAEWEATPDDPPAVAAEAASGSTAVYASWNGATEVVRWRVLTGASPEALTPAGEAAKAGFETRLTVPGRHAYVAVQALDAGGRVLGVSAAERPA